MSTPTTELSGRSKQLRAILQGWKIILLGTLVGCAAGIAIARWIHPRFKAEALIQIDTQSRRPLGALGEMADLFQSDTKAETETEIVQSNSVIGTVVDKYNLQNMWASEGILRRLMHKEGRIELDRLELPPDRPEVKGTWTVVALDSHSTFLVRDPSRAVVARGSVGDLVRFLRGKDSVAIRISSMQSSPGESFKIFKISKVGAIQAVQGGLSVVEKGRRTNILSLSYSNRFNDKARDILRSIADAYVRQNVDVRSAEARKTLEYLQQQLPQVKSHLDSLEGILNSFRFQKGTVDIGTEARVYLDDQSRIQQQLITLEQQRQDLLRLYREDHPSILAIEAQKNQLQRALAGSNLQVKKLPITQQQVIKISRDMDAYTTQYTSLMNNIQQLRVVQGGEVGNARIVDYPEVPDHPVGPAPFVIILAATIFGAAVGLGSLIGLNAMRNGITNPADLEATGIQVLAQIPESPYQRGRKKDGDKRGILAQAAPNELALDAIRSLRIALNLFLAQSDNKIVAIGGLTPGVGKSFVSSNLAAIVAQSGKRVVIVDGDLRRGQLHSIFGLKDAGGLSEIIQRKMALENVLRPTSIQGLWLLGRGESTDNASNLFESLSFAEILKQLSENFDLILIDTSPFLLVADSFLVFQRAAQTLVVLQSGAHSVATVNEGIRKLQQFGIEGVSFVLNQCELADTNYRGYGAYGKK